MARILVTGADGFTGIHLVRALRDAGHVVHGLIRAPGLPFPVRDIALHHGDLRSEAQLTALIRKIRPEKTIHLAAISFVAHQDADELYNVNLLGTRHLLQAIAAQDGTPGTVLLASSANVYGNKRSGVIDESMAPDPVNDYAVSKLAMEYLARTYQYRLPIVIARPFNYTGVGQSKNFLIPKIVDHIQRRAETIELGNIDVERDWSDVRRVTQAYCQLIESEAAIGSTVNICSGGTTSLRGVLDLASRLAGHHMEIRVNPALVRANEVHSLRGSTERLTSIAGPLPAYTIEDTLRWMLSS